MGTGTATSDIKVGSYSYGEFNKQMQHTAESRAYVVHKTQGTRGALSAVVT